MYTGSLLVYTGNLDVTGAMLKLRDGGGGGVHFLLLASLSSTAYHRPVLRHLPRKCMHQLLTPQANMTVI